MKHPLYLCCDGGEIRRRLLLLELLNSLNTACRYLILKRKLFPGEWSGFVSTFSRPSKKFRVRRTSQVPVIPGFRSMGTGTPEVRYHPGL
jgi:hypothetical protein